MSLKYETEYCTAAFNHMVYDEPYRSLCYRRHNRYHRENGPADIREEGLVIWWKYGNNTPINPDPDPGHYASRLQQSMWDCIRESKYVT